MLDWNDNLLALPSLKVKSAKLFSTGAPVELTRLKDGMVLHLPKQRDEVDTIVVLTR